MSAARSIFNLGFDPKDSGWIPHHDRTYEVSTITSKINRGLLNFDEFNYYFFDEDLPDVAYLWKFTKQMLGKHIPVLYQQTGSCVGNANWNAWRYSNIVEVALGETEQIVEWFMPYSYGKGRECSGINGRGDGSTGSGQVEAIEKYGMLLQTDDLPQPQGGDEGYTWGSSVEMGWSDGDSINSKYVERAKPYILKQALKINNTEEARAGMAKGYAIFNCSSIGFKMNPGVTDNILINRYADTWNHAITFLAYRKYKNSWLYWYQNSWSADAHGKCPCDLGCPLGGFWITEEDMKRMINQDETYLYIDPNSPPARRNLFRLG